jgi:hypothetical protein
MLKDVFAPPQTSLKAKQSKSSIPVLLATQLCKNYFSTRAIPRPSLRSHTIFRISSETFLATALCYRARQSYVTHDNSRLVSSGTCRPLLRFRVVTHTHERHSDRRLALSTQHQKLSRRVFLASEDLFFLSPRPSFCSNNHYTLIRIFFLLCARTFVKK